jgi:hypothetical protein
MRPVMSYAISRSLYNATYTADVATFMIGLSLRLGLASDDERF